MGVIEQGRRDATTQAMGVVEREAIRSLEEALDYISQAKKALGRWYITGRPLPDAITDLIRAHETLQLRVAKWLRQEAERLLHESHVNIRAYNVLCRTADRLEVGEEPQGARTGTARVPGVRPGTAPEAEGEHVTYEEIPALEGPALNAAVAEHVMGWKRYTAAEILKATGADVLRWGGDPPEPESFLLWSDVTQQKPEWQDGLYVVTVYPPPDYAGDASLAMEALERAAERTDRRFVIVRLEDGWLVGWLLDQDYIDPEGGVVDARLSDDARHERFPVAACRAALLAVLEARASGPAN